MTAATIERRWLSWKEASGYCGLSERTLRRLVAAGRLAASRPRTSGNRGRTLLDRLALDRLLEEAARRPAT